jgi:REP element-mobilizing transposase RayT
MRVEYESGGAKSAVMSRPLRIEYPGAVYHVLCRGNNRQKIFRDDLDCRRYLEKLVHYCELKEVLLLGYCLLSNHIHLLVETPLGNLSKMMQAFQTSYTLYFNRRHGRSGHVFEQRYKALLVATPLGANYRSFRWQKLKLETLECPNWPTENYEESNDPVLLGGGCSAGLFGDRSVAPS